MEVFLLTPAEKYLLHLITFFSDFNRVRFHFCRLWTVRHFQRCLKHLALMGEIDLKRVGNGQSGKGGRFIL